MWGWITSLQFYNLGRPTALCNGIRCLSVGFCVSACLCFLFFNLSPFFSLDLSRFGALINRKGGKVYVKVTITESTNVSIKNNIPKTIQKCKIKEHETTNEQKSSYSIFWLRSLPDFCNWSRYGCPEAEISQATYRINFTWFRLISLRINWLF